MADVKHFNDYYHERITEENITNLDEVFPGVVDRIKLFSLENFMLLLSTGNLLLLTPDDYYVIKLTHLPKRGIETSNFDPTNIFESCAGFNDTALDNISLIRKRIKSSNLEITKLTLGNRAINNIYVIAMKDTTSRAYYKKIIMELNFANLDSCNSINDINKLFQTNSLVPMTINTGSPDTFVECILKGKVGIVIDNCPVTAILPGTFTLFTSNKAEINAPRYYTIFNRIFIFTFFFLSLFSLGFFIAIINFQPNDMLLMLIANIQLTERGTSFPMIVEIFIVLFMFEFYRLTVSRSPNNYVQNIVIIFGGLFIGENAISSGTVGALSLLITSISFIASFALTNNPHIITSISIFRIFILLMSFGLGLIGFIVSSLITMIYFVSLKSVGQPFFAPFFPNNLNKIKDFFTPSEKKMTS